MTREADSPIIVTGPGRSGTTWMQWFLSQHPRIQIHGQPPNPRWEVAWRWYRKLAQQGEWARKANREVGYEIAHYAGSSADRVRDIFGRAARDFLTGFGPSKPRWGVKWIGLCEQSQAVAQVETFWPKTRFVVCVRDFFVTFDSLKNTFVPAADLRNYAARWVETCRFAESHEAERVAVVQMDKLANQSWQERKRVMDGVLECVGEEACRETDDFIQGWPSVHKVTPDAERSFGLSGQEREALIEEVPELAHYMRKMDYELFARTGTAARSVSPGGK